MIKKIRINNMFTNLPPDDGVILACKEFGKILYGDKIIISSDREIVISKIERNVMYSEINILLSEEELNGFQFSYSLIGK